jgi:hypothetical protein
MLRLATRAATASSKDTAEISATDWRAHERNTLRGFCTLVLPSGLVIRDCSLHEREGKRWIGLPRKPWSKSDGTTGYEPIVDFATDEARLSFQLCAVAAVLKLLEGAR